MQISHGQHITAARCDGHAMGCRGQRMHHMRSEQWRRRTKGLHATVGVVDDKYLLRAQQPLGDDQAADGGLVDATAGIADDMKVACGTASGSSVSDIWQVSIGCW